jgi:Domain of unknown function (DUF1963)
MAALVVPFPAASGQAHRESRHLHEQPEVGLDLERSDSLLCGTGIWAQREALKVVHRRTAPPNLGGPGVAGVIAEIDCGQLPSDALSLPHTGTLSFFCWDEQLGGMMPWRGTPEARGAARVVYIPAGTPVSERDPPAGIAPYDLVELTGELFHGQSREGGEGYPEPIRIPLAGFR